MRTLLGGCSTPISALAEVKDNKVYLRGNILSTDGKHKVEIEKTMDLVDSPSMGSIAAAEILNKGGSQIADAIRNGK